MVDLLIFSADWCGPCKAMERAGIYDSIKAAGFPITKIDVDKERAIADQYGITAMPTYIIRRDSVPVGRLIGARDAKSFIAELQRFA